MRVIVAHSPLMVTMNRTIGVEGVEDAMLHSIFDPWFSLHDFLTLEAPIAAFISAAFLRG
jgi:hypothetical protein